MLLGIVLGIDLPFPVLPGSGKLGVETGLPFMSWQLNLWRRWRADHARFSWRLQFG